MFSIDTNLSNLYLCDMEMMPITPERKAQLDEYAQRHGQDAATALDEALAAYLAWERQDFEEAVAGIQRCFDYVQSGRSPWAEPRFTKLL